jgi:hypothetical protein
MKQKTHTLEFFEEVDKHARQVVDVIVVDVQDLQRGTACQLARKPSQLIAAHSQHRETRRPAAAART